MSTVLFRLARGMHHAIVNRARQSRSRTRRMVDSHLRRCEVAKLHIGCGENQIAGWLNSDFDLPGRSMIYLDVAQRFPLPGNRFDVIFSEHVIEHVTLDAAFNMLRECHRILKPGGRVRISTPFLEFLLDLVARPVDDHRRYLDYHCAGSDAPICTPAVVLADYYTKWGHRFVYDEPTLRSLLEAAGFEAIEMKSLNESAEPMLRNLENEARMPAGLLKLTTFTLEAVKPSA